MQSQILLWGCIEKKRVRSWGEERCRGVKMRSAFRRERVGGVGPGKRCERSMNRRCRRGGWDEWRETARRKDSWLVDPIFVGLWWWRSWVRGSG